ncbi:snurportin-1 [Ooceraea biroi]|uniref:Snurportin-1 n=1 Tax=Ooceraea biroi TaxID=2015173 RepID=A0A026W6W2_OOCBI|nr:snurportin-1 [Ooceraea biroi]XP_011342735.1 snurportin-1 [Ooceraea biroi]EZA51847.1 Snurportin-1 [Ooceraea biroi]
MTTEILNNEAADNKISNREDIRRTFYKSRIRKDNIKLELDDDTPQEERRKLLLEYQKKHREEAFNTARGILKDIYFPDEEDGEESMDVEQYRSKSKYYGRPRHHLMMLSEWMTDVPQDLIENWIMVPCPEGKRSRLVAGKGITKVYSRKGDLCSTFHSALPGGNPNAHRHHYTVLDCIWVSSQSIYYILDVLSWRVQPFTNCEAAFRLHWIKTRISEVEELKERDTEDNAHPILPLPHIKCDSDLSVALNDLVPKLPPLDGLLFYHSKAYYNFGRTPLVTWLKPFMMPEVLGISAPSPLDEKPDNYVSFEDHVNNATRKIQRSKKVVRNFMEIV